MPPPAPGRRRTTPATAQSRAAPPTSRRAPPRRGKSAASGARPHPRVERCPVQVASDEHQPAVARRFAPGLAVLRFEQHVHALEHHRLALAADGQDALHAEDVLTTLPQELTDPLIELLLVEVAGH